MRTVTIAGARRRETVAAARHRMKVLLPSADVPTEPQLPTTGAPPEEAAAVVADPSSAPTPALRSRLPPALLGALELDRRAVAGLLVLLLAAVGYAAQHFWLGRPRQISVPAVTAPAAPAAAVTAPGPAVTASLPAAGPPRPSPAPTPTVVVDVAGKVRHPGLQTLPRGSRVADALRAAGGPQAGADTTGLNLARVVADGEQILVGRPGAPPAGGPTAASGAGAPPTGPVSLNTATVEQFDALPGVGPVLAQHIVQYREAHSGFSSVEQLRQVNGIGDRKFADLRPLVTL